MKAIVISVLVFLGSAALSIFSLPEACSLLNNEPGPFMNCLQEFPKLCCTDREGVLISRSILAIGAVLSIAAWIYSTRRSNTNGDPVA